MTLKELILSENSKRMWMEVATRALQSEKDLAMLMSYFESTDICLVQRATQSISKVYDLDKQKLKPYFIKMIQGLEEPRIDAYKRNVMRIFQTAEIPEDYEGHLFDKAFTYLESKTEPIAVKAFAMTVARRIAIKHPDLIPEVVEAIELMLEENESAGVQNRGGHELKKLKKLLK